TPPVNLSTLTLIKTLVFIRILIVYLFNFKLEKNSPQQSFLIDAPAMWYIRRFLEDFDSNEIYEHYANVIMLKIHHDGMFTRRPRRQYVDDKTTFIDLVDVDELNVHEINTMVTELGYTDGLVEDDSEEECKQDDGEDVDYMVDKTHEMEEVDIDMKNFNSIIECDAEWLGNKEKVGEESNLGEDDNHDLVKVDAFYSGSDSEFEGDRKRQLRKLGKHQRTKKTLNFNFYVGKSFRNKKEIKDLIGKHSIETRRDLSIVKKDGSRKIFRAKAMAMERAQGNYSAQYTMLRDYILEQHKINRGTTVKLEVETEPNLDMETRKFERIYVCFGALKNGFKSCDMELLGLDGTFMKGPFPGQILTVVGIDPNHGTYPISYVIVEGIILAIARIFPSTEHRFFLRHIHENIKKI
ncbi:Transposase, MuDR, plant, partial [Cynara cardunculus var. scolymus]